MCKQQGEYTLHLPAAQAFCVPHRMIQNGANRGVTKRFELGTLPAECNTHMHMREAVTSLVPAGAQSTAERTGHGC